MLNTILPSESGIYAIRNTINNKVYVGSATNLRKRMLTHISLLNSSKHHSKKLQSSWNKNGGSSFSVDVLEYVADVSDLIITEQKWIDSMLSYGKKGYNMTPIAGSIIGSIRSEEAKKITAEKNRGSKRSDETKKRISEAGMNRSQESIDKMRASLTGRKLSEDHRLKCVSRRATPETKLKMSLSHTGMKQSKDAIERTAAAHRGKKRSEETCKKISEAGKARWEKVRLNATQ